MNKKHLLIILLLTITTTTQLTFPKYDFIQYWSSSKVLDTSLNPYKKENLETLQYSVRNFDDVIRMWNPPFIFPLIYPLKFFSNYNLIENLWTLLAILTYVVCAYFLVKKYIGKSYKEYFLYLSMILFAFPPFWALLHMAQIGFILLFAATSYLLFRDNKQYFLAGCLLSISLIKPHSFYLLYLFSFLSDIKIKNFKPILGFIFGGTVLFIASLLIAPDGWTWYIEAMKSPPVYFKTTTIGSFLMEVFGFQYKFLRFLPMFICVPICLKLLCKNLNEQMTRAITIAVIPLSQLTSPYGWPADQLAMLPSIIYLLSFIVSEKSLNKTRIKMILAFLVLLNLIGYIAASTRSYDELVWYTTIISLICLLPLSSTASSNS